MRFCSPMSSFRPAPAGSAARSFTVAINVPRRVAIRLVFVFAPELSPYERGLATLLFYNRLAGRRLAHLTLPVQQIKAGTDNDGRARHGPGVRQMVEYQVAEDHHPDQLGIDEGRQHRC